MTKTHQNVDHSQQQSQQVSLWLLLTQATMNNKSPKVSGQ